MDSLYSEITALRNDMKAMAKLLRKVRSHQEDPTGEKSKARSRNNGFNREVGVTDKLREFLGLEEGKLIARSEVTRQINNYIKDNNLKHPDNGRIIVLDDKLTDLLSPPEGVQVTFLNIQKYLSPLFLKSESRADDESQVPDTADSETQEPAETPTKTVKKVVKRPVVRKVVKA
jgi:upstream activation factor subunit UAF30